MADAARMLNQRRQKKTQAFSLLSVRLYVLLFSAILQEEPFDQCDSRSDISSPRKMTSKM